MTVILHFLKKIFHAEKEISGLCFLGLSIKYWESCGVSVPGVVALTRLQERIKAAQFETPTSPRVSGSYPLTLSISLLIIYHMLSIL